LPCGKAEYKDKWKLCNTTNAEGRSGGIAEALAGADICVALLAERPGCDQEKNGSPRWLKIRSFLRAPTRSRNVALGCQGSGAAIVATGRSDFPNQVNNSLGFRGIFRGSLDVRARTITDEMCIAAAVEMATMAEENGLRDDYIMPTMDEVDVVPA